MRITTRLAALVAACLLLAPLAATSAPQTAPTPGYPLTRGETGQSVKALQWILGGHKPSAYRGISTFKYKPNGLYGQRTETAVRRMKYRLGYPARMVQGKSASVLFVAILKGERKRPLAWIARAARRVKEGVPGAGKCAQKVLTVARREIGVREYPWGSNWGGRVALFQTSTGAYHAPWCVSYVQWVLKTAGYGTIANRSAGVFYVVGYARQRGWVRARATPGALVAFMDRLGHIGLVERVTGTGFVSIEGNASNSVLRRFHDYRRNLVFIWLPRCT